MKIWQSNIYPTLTSFSVLPFLQSSLHGKLFFFSPDVLKRWSVPKICDGLWSFLCYWDIWYFFFPKIWSYPLRRKWNLIFLKEKKNTRKYDISFKCSEKMVFAKWFALGHDLSCIIWKDGIFSQKHGIFSLGEKRGAIIFKEYMEVWNFLWTRTGVTNVALCPSVKKNKDNVTSQKYTRRWSTF